MGDFAGWLALAPASPDTAFAAHRRLVEIHPGYPPIPVRPQDRLEYIRALQQAQAGEGMESLNRLLAERLDATPGEYLSALQG